MTMLGNIIRARSGPWEEHLKGYNSRGSNDQESDADHQIATARYVAFWGSIAIAYPSRPRRRQVRPRMTHTLTRKGMTKIY
ncbi:hypothetical protein Taro_028866 [Colocasia esculenta]|uniref:Uncharacterized protein n=1 Tax=Colocasia esculenta TaxID=4460 RepID=A0A843VT62_COLES|nr:hypothetical protein [Colocasia esculenta]